MTRFFTAFITIPLAIIAVIFAVANRDVIRIDLGVVDYVIETPLYLVILVPLFVGLFAGGLIVTIAHMKLRFAVLGLRRDLERLTEERDMLAEQLDQQKSAEEESKGGSNALTVISGGRS